MKVVYDPAFDGGTWPGPVLTDGVSVGEFRVGPQGLLSLLELHLGLGGRTTTTAARVAAIAAMVEDTEGFWSASADADLFATARRLLEQRDLLRLAGWQGQSFTNRLGALARVTDSAAPGWPDRIAAVLDRLRDLGESVGAIFDEVVVLEPTDDQPGLWQELFVALGEHIPVRRETPAKAAATGDLGAVREGTGDVAVAGDGSVQLVRAHGPLRAADDIAAWLASLGPTEIEHTLIIGADATLDRALARHGLPVVGAPSSSSDVPLLQILPLALSLIWAPADPQRALELLSLPQSPVPGGLRHRLARALGEWPSTRSGDWETALEEGLAGIPEPRRERVARRIDVLFGARTERDSECSLEEIENRVEVIAGWARSQLAFMERGEKLEATQEDSPQPDNPRAVTSLSVPAWGALLGQLHIFGELLTATKASMFSSAELGRLLSAATAAVSLPAENRAESGFISVREPGTVTAPVRRIVWWQCTASTWSEPARAGISPGDIKALNAEGILLPDRGQQTSTAFDRAMRPLLMASEQLVLVAPHTEVDGTEASPHPVWDVVGARLSSETEAKLVRAVPRGDVDLPIRSLRSAARARQDWTIDPLREVNWPDRISPSAIGRLLGCSFSWAVERVGRVRRKFPTRLPEGPLLFGRLAHEVLAEVLREAAAAPEKAVPDEAAFRAALLAGVIFDREATLRAASLCLPGAERDLAAARFAVVESAREITRLMGEAGAYPFAVETEVETPFDKGMTLRGTPDLVVGAAQGVVDYKWGGATGRREEIEDGEAYQLAAYSRMLSSGRAAKIPFAYFILTRQELLPGPGMPIGGAALEGPSPKDSWERVEDAVQQAREDLDGGRIVARYEAAASRPSRRKKKDEQRGLEISPPCQYCDLDAVCGRRFAQGVGS